MEIIDIFGKLGGIMGNEVNDIMNNHNLIVQYGDIIIETINEYNYKGDKFKIEYLPLIMAMALKKLDEKKIITDRDKFNSIFTQLRIKQY